MRCLLILTASIFAFTTADASPPVVLTVPSAGTYVIQFDANNTPTLFGPVSSITPGGVTPVPPAPPVPPSPPVPPVPDSLTVRGREILLAADRVTDANRAVTAANLASALDMIQGQISSGTIKTYAQVGAAVNWMADSVIGPKAEQWKSVKTLLGQHLATLAQDGAQPEEYSGYLAEAADGLRASIPPQEANAVNEKAIDMDQLLKLLMFFMQYILPLII